MPRKPNTELRRRQIIEGLLKTMAVHGYAGATIQAVAAASGLAPGLLHYHFHDKREMLVALVDQLVAYAQHRYEVRANSATTPRERLRAYIDARLAYGEDANPDAVAAWVMIGAEAVRDAEVREIYRRAAERELALLQRLLKACLVHEGKRVRRLNHVAAGLLAYVEGCFMLAANARDLVPRGFAAEMAAEWVDRYIAQEAASARVAARPTPSRRRSAP